MLAVSRFRRCCAAATFVSQLDALQKAWIRREGVPQEVKRQAEYLAESSTALIPSLEPAHVAGFAACCATVLRDANEAVIAAAVEGFQRAMEQPSTDLATLASIAEALVVYGPRSASCAPLSRAVYSRAAEELLAQRDPSPTTPRHVDATLRLGAAVHTPHFKFIPMTHCSRALLPMKPKLQMQAKLHKCPHARQLLHKLADCSLSRLDAIRWLQTLASRGFYDERVVNASCEALRSTLQVVAGRQLAQVAFALGVLGHRHVLQGLFNQHVTPTELSAEDVRRYAFGLAMLQVPPRGEVLGRLHDAVWLHTRRGGSLPVTWHADVLYALSMCGAAQERYTVHACRTLFPLVKQLPELQLMRLMYAVGDAHTCEVRDASLHNNWRKVKRVRKAVVARAATVTWVGFDQRVYRDALQHAGEAPLPRVAADEARAMSSTADGVLLAQMTELNTPW